MAWAWAPIALLGLTIGAVNFALATLIYGAGARRRQDLLLVGMLMARGIQGLCGAGLMYLVTEPADAFAFQFITYLASFPSAALMLLFAGTFPTPLSRPFRTRVGATLVGLAAALVCIASLVDSSLILRGVVPATYAPWDGDGSAFMALWFLAAPLFSVYLVFVGIHATRLTPQGSTAHAHSRVLVRAVGLTCGSYVVALPMLAFATTPGVVVMALGIITAGSLGQAVILAHGILKSQLFDIDLRVKWTIRKGTVAAAFVGVFFVVSEAAQSFLSTQMGPVAGLLAAGALVFAIAPLQRLADRVGDTAMPRVRDDAEYRTVRKREVYRAAVESALEAGDISAKERGMLATFAEELGLGPKEMHDIEREARAARAGVTA